MKRTDLKKLNTRSAEELTKDIFEAKEKLWQLRREIASGKVKNNQSRTALRRDIARMFTAISAKRSTKQS